MECGAKGSYFQIFLLVSVAWVLHVLSNIALIILDMLKNMSRSYSLRIYLLVDVIVP